MTHTTPSVNHYIIVMSKCVFLLSKHNVSELFGHRSKHSNIIKHNINYKLINKKIEMRLVWNELPIEFLEFGWW